MALSNTKKEKIQEIIINTIRNKFKKYKPKNNNMPFHYRLLGKDRMALYSFIQSLNTTFGTSIFEPVAVALAENNFIKVKSQYIVGNYIYRDCHDKITEIIRELSIVPKPNKDKELYQLRHSLSGSTKKIKTVKVDLFVESSSGEQYLFDIKTAKPNKSGFQKYKQTLLEWAGIALTENKKSKIHTLISIPYNPYEPEPYHTWTMAGMIDIKKELLVAEGFWDFLGGKGAYNTLLNCFEKAGIYLRPEIDKYFSKFK